MMRSYHTISYPFRTKSLLLIAVISLLARIACSDSSSSSELTTSQLLSKANSLLATGQASKALELYELALARDPDDYLTLYKKATTQMSLGHYNHATNAFQKVLSLKDFDKARIQLAKIHLKSADYDACQSELASYSQSHPKSDEHSLILSDLEFAKRHLKAARSNQKSKLYLQCVDEASAAVQISPQSSDLRQLRSDCHLLQGHIQEAVNDLTRVVHLSPTNSVAARRLSFLSYFLLEQPLEQAMKPIKQCLHFDPESGPCKTAFRQLKSTETDLTKVRNFSNSDGHRSAIKLLIPKSNESDALIAKIKMIIQASQKSKPQSGMEQPLIPPSLNDLESKSQLLTSLYSFACKAYIGLNDLKQAQPICETLHARDPEDRWGLIAKAEALMAAEDWESAVNLLSDAYKKNENEEIGNRLRKAQKGLKISKQKDYYEVLGVPKNADDRTLKKAYRKATLKAHPDKGGSQAKMTALNEAYEVLSNPELRTRYDNGDDPNDPMSGHRGNPFEGFHGGGGNPIFQQFFQQDQSGGGNPFGGGQFAGSSSGQTFSFRFG